MGIVRFALEAMCRITFKFNQSAIQDLVLEHAKHREAA